MGGRILVIRGGAIGDFILTLPALALLRENFPESALEILGYKSTIALAHQRHYAVATRSIEYGPLARFFIPNSELPKELVEYFKGFDQVISYLFDPDNFFVNNLRKAGVKHLLQGSGKLDESAHATRQLAKPLEQMALYLECTDTRLYPSAVDEKEASDFLKQKGSLFIAIHPGSGSHTKNWSVKKWCQLIQWIDHQYSNPTIVLIGGEADSPALEFLKTQLSGYRLLIAQNIPLPRLAAILKQCHLFLGHDSGISHIAAAVGIPSLLLFGPTNEQVWAPTNSNVQIISSLDRTMKGISLSIVQSCFEKLNLYKGTNYL